MLDQRGCKMDIVADMCIEDRLVKAQFYKPPQNTEEDQPRSLDIYNVWGYDDARMSCTSL